MNFDYLGRFVRSYRQANNESLQSMADRSGVSRSMIGQIETGQKSPTLAALAKLAEAMNIRLEDLVKAPNNDQLVQRLRVSETNVVSRKDSPFVCHQLAVKSASSAGDFYRFYFRQHGKTRFSANPTTGCIKYIWVEQGELTLLLSSTRQTIKPEQGLQFDATLPHSFENRYGDLVKGTFFVAYS